MVHARELKGHESFTRNHFETLYLTMLYVSAFKITQDYVKDT
jgi:hypothetical protein